MKRHLLNPYPADLLTGEPSKPFWQGGFSMLPLLMGTAPSGGDGASGDGSTSGDSGGSGGGSTDPAGGDSGSGGDGGSGDSGHEESVPLSKFKQMEEQLRAADRRRAEFENKLKAIEDKDKSELERATGKVQELEQVKAQLEKQLQTLRVQNAFLMGNSYSWHDPEDALALAERKGFLDEAINKETGEIDQDKVKAGLKAFADKHKHLIKEASPDEGDGKGSSKKEPKQGTATPPPVGSNGAGNKGGTGKSDEELKRKYRALQNY